jgi:adenosylcobinamide kinase / adenosylcobinamide-phosphate guanylyltransferase
LSNAVNSTILSNPLENLTVITGGARSGKSLFAEELALKSDLPVSYLATMPHIPDDPELSFKVEQHRNRRPSHWRTVEAELAIHESLDELPTGPAVCVIDCLSLYVSNIMLAVLNDAEEPVQPSTLRTLDQSVSEAIGSLSAAISRRQDLTFIVVTNEVGWSVVPDNKMARIYKDLLGNANQTLATRASTVYLACIGLRIKLKENGLSKLE